MLLTNKNNAFMFTTVATIGLLLIKDTVFDSRTNIFYKLNFLLHSCVVASKIANDKRIPMNS